MTQKRISGVVFRIEGPDGKGPYRTQYNSLGWQDEDHHERHQHPDPHSDGIDDMSSQYYCGFESTEKMVEWFSPTEIERLVRDGGCKVYMYLLDPYLAGIKYGETQCVFKLSDEAISDKRTIGRDQWLKGAQSLS